MRCFATSESNGSNLPCVAAKNISAVQSKTFSKCVQEYSLKTRFELLGNLVSFVLTVTTCYKKETSVESSFSSIPAPSRFSHRNLNRPASKSNTRQTERLMLLLLAFNRRSIEKPSANRQIIFEKCSFRSNQLSRAEDSHAVCSIPIGCILQHHRISVE